MEIATGSLSLLANRRMYSWCCWIKALSRRCNFCAV